MFVSSLPFTEAKSLNRMLGFMSILLRIHGLNELNCYEVHMDQKG